jgi:phosphate transport system substrate-binding protein
VFEQKLLDAGCAAAKAPEVIKTLITDEKAAAAKCHAVRKDGVAVDIDGDYSETLARIDSNKNAVGVFGLSFFENNADKLKVASISGVVPSGETVASGEYPVSRPLFFYVKKAHLGVIAGLKEYVNFFVSDAQVGPDSVSVEQGLISMPADELKKVQAEIASAAK